MPIRAILVSRILLSTLLICLCAPTAPTEEQHRRITRSDIDVLLDATVHEWRFRLGEVPGAEAPDFDDSAWETVDVGHQWWPHDSTCWYRTRLVIPETINGLPTAGAAIRMRAAMDNAARAYVNGEFRQEFERDAGDFLITDRAVPGETFVVALHGVNRPGYGSLYQAYLTSSCGSEMTRALRDLMADCDITQSYILYAPEADAAHWRALVNDALQALDLAAYKSLDVPRFLVSVDAARERLFADAATLDTRLDATAGELRKLEQLIEQGAHAGSRMVYLRVDTRVIKSFLQYIRDDMEDGVTGHKIRALTAARYLEQLCADALREAQSILFEPTRDLRVPVYTTGPVETRDGAFWQDARPVFFTGVGHFGQVREDLPILPDYGLNIIQIEMGPNSVVTGPDTIDETPIHNNILAALDRAAANSVAVNLLISPHYFPDWMLEQHPELAECGHGFMKHCIDAPESRAVYERYLRALMPLIAKHPALHSICLSNEPQYDGRCEHTRRQFHAWLAKRYTDVADANALYGTQFKAFDDVPIPEDNSNYAAAYDYWSFNQDRFLAFHEFLRDLIHEFDPDLPVHAKAMAHSFGDPGKFEVGVDYEAFTRIGAVAGNDCVQTFEGDSPSEYLQRWRDMAMHYTFQHCVAPDAPIFNSEDHIITDGDVRYIPESHIRTAYWTQAIHGQGAATTWVWERAQGGDFAENLLTRANCVRALGRIACDLNRLATEVYALQRAPSDAAILYSFASLWPSDTFTTQATAAFEALYFADTTPAFVTERQAGEGRLRDYKVIIAPNASHVSDTTVSALQAYLDCGGTLVTIGECFTRDEHGRTRTTLPQAGVAGRVIAKEGSLDARACRDLLDPILDEAGCRRPIRITDTDGAPVWGVNLRAAEHEGRLIVSLVNFSRKPLTVLIHRNKGPHQPNLPKPEEPEYAPVSKMIDLFRDQETTAPLTLDPLEPWCVEIDARPSRLE